VLPSNQGTLDGLVAARRAACNIYCILIYGGGSGVRQREFGGLEFGID
jgi:hypothetical protein